MWKKCILHFPIFRWFLLHSQQPTSQRHSEEKQQIHILKQSERANSRHSLGKCLIYLSSYKNSCRLLIDKLLPLLKSFLCTDWYDNGTAHACWLPFLFFGWWTVSFLSVGKNNWSHHQTLYESQRKSEM